MPNANELVKIIKKTALDAVNASNPAAFVFGKVIGVNPLKINVEQKLTLSEMQLVFTRNVTDYEIEIAVDWVTENSVGGSGESAFDTHNHAVNGTKKITVYNGLVVGDTVLLARQQGGQKFIVLDKIL